MTDAVINPGDRVWDRHGSVWTVERVRVTRLGTLLDVRCLQSSPSMRGLDVGDTTTLPACTLGLTVVG